MFIQTIEILSRYYFQITKIISAILPIEIEIKNIDQHKIGYKYYYYLFNYYINDFLDHILYSCCRYNSRYRQINLYEITYRRKNMIKTTIINGTIKDIFNYTRAERENDKIAMFLKCNLIIDEVSNSIRQLIRKYDLNTKLYDIIYFNYLNDISSMKMIQLEMGKKIYNIYEMDRNLLLEDA